VRARTLMLNKSVWQTQTAKKNETIRTYPAVCTILVSPHTRALVRTAPDRELFFAKKRDSYPVKLRGTGCFRRNAVLGCYGKYE